MGTGRRRAHAIDRLDDTIGEMDREGGAEHNHLVAQIGRPEKLSSDVTVGGIRWEATGLILVLLGLALQGVALTIT
jgi:hypothetical protein